MILALLWLSWGAGAEAALPQEAPQSAAQADSTEEPTPADTPGADPAGQELAINAEPSPEDDISARLSAAPPEQPLPRELLRALLQHPSPTVRSQLAARLGAFTPAQAAAWWWLLHDPDTNVREHALVRLGALCEAGGEVACASLATGLQEADRDLRWLARDGLVLRQPKRALRGASRDYKLDLLARLAVEVERRGPLMPRALQIMWHDTDPEVQAVAQTLVNLTTP